MCRSCLGGWSPHVMVSALVHLHKAWNLGQSEVVSIMSTSPLHSRSRFRRMKNGLHIRLASCSWCAAKWVWPQPARSTRWHWGWWVFSNWRLGRRPRNVYCRGQWWHLVALLRPEHPLLPHRGASATGAMGFFSAMIQALGRGVTHSGAGIVTHSGATYSSPPNMCSKPSYTC